MVMDTRRTLWKKWWLHAISVVAHAPRGMAHTKADISDCVLSIIFKFQKRMRTERRSGCECDL